MSSGHTRDTVVSREAGRVRSFLHDQVIKASLSYHNRADFAPPPLYHVTHRWFDNELATRMITYRFQHSV